MKQLTPRQINAQRRKDGKPPLSFRLLRRIVRKLETNPEAYDQGIWGRPDEMAPCGTAACIAGWACFLDGKKSLEALRRNPKSAATIAAKSIGLDVDVWAATDERVLFDGDPRWSWPEPFADRWKKAKGRKAQARVAVAYLNHIITTGKVLE